MGLPFTGMNEWCTKKEYHLKEQTHSLKPKETLLNNIAAVIGTEEIILLNCDQTGIYA